ncbi:hypothetical protein CC2G_009451 [Coprinopsis cinerea AmutBmut pab1-1]|nr:hypothetical protein CC2G_009451 [Coprinopsis cinerea AmutBmut pab1-1]
MWARLTSIARFGHTNIHWSRAGSHWPDPSGRLESVRLETISNGLQGTPPLQCTISNPTVLSIGRHLGVWGSETPSPVPFKLSLGLRGQVWSPARKFRA